MEGNIRNVCGGMVARRMCRERSHTVTEKKYWQIALEGIANWPIRLLALLGCSRAVRDKVSYSRTTPMGTSVPRSQFWAFSVTHTRPG